MKKLATILLAGCLALSAFAGLAGCVPENPGGTDGDPDDGKPDEEIVQGEKEYDVILFTGQSNMVGRETSRYSVNIANGMALEYKMNQNQFVAVQNPVGEAFGESEASSGSSIVPAFCETYTKETGRKVIAVHVARGGREISYFVPGGALHRDILQKFDKCLQAMEDKDMIVGHSFYVFYQGESDTTNGSTGEKYKERFLSYHNAVKEKFGFEFGADIYIGKNTQLNEAGIRTINTAKKELAEQHDDIIVAEKSPALMYRDSKEYLRMSANDDTHLNATGLRLVGTNAATNVANFLGLGKDKTKKGIDPVTYIEEPAYDRAPEPSEPSEPVATEMTYEWTFDGQVAEKSGALTATHQGTGTPSFTGNKYSYQDATTPCYYQLSGSIRLPASKNWTVEWKGFSGRTMSGHASVLLSNGQNVFITFQDGNGIYVRNNAATAKFGPNMSLEDMYTSHVWILSYDAAAHKIELIEDGTSKGKLDWNADLEFTHLLGSSYNGGGNNNYSYTGELEYLKIGLPKPAESAAGTSYEWTFEGQVAEKNGTLTATHQGTGTPSFTGNKYSYQDATTPCYYQLSGSVTLSASKNWTVEWKGFSGRTMSGHACVLLSKGSDVFITFQDANGIYVRNGNVTAKFGPNMDLEDMYTSHVWKLVYDAATHKIELIEDGTSKGKLDWNADLEFTHLLGSSYNGGGNNNYSYTGELEYLKIVIG